MFLVPLRDLNVGELNADQSQIMQRFLFPRWINPLLGWLAVAAAAGAVFAGAMGGLITDPQTLNIGYQPEQPVPFSHAIHAGQLKMDCRYCHNTVFDAAHAAVPPTATCINCHSPANDQGVTATAAVHSDSEKLAPIRESWNTGRSVAWKRVHNLPEFVYFNHAAHVNSGVILQNLSWSSGPDGSRLPARTAIDGLVHHLPSQSESTSPPC